MHILMIISMLTREATSVAMYVCVFTRILHISKYLTRLFERKWLYAHDAAGNSLLSVQIALVVKMDCKSGYIVVQALNFAVKIVDSLCLGLYKVS